MRDRSLRLVNGTQLDVAAVPDLVTLHTGSWRRVTMTVAEARKLASYLSSAADYSESGKRD